MDSFPPMLDIALSDTLLPTFIDASTDNDAPKRTPETTDSDEPLLNAHLKDILLLIVVKFRTERDEPNVPMLLTLQLLPRYT
jgi:hypothetical protein